MAVDPIQSAKKPPAISDKLPLRLKIFYSSGDLSTSIPQAILIFFQLYFLTDVAGLRPDYAAWAIAAGRVWDAINDPLFGLFSDRLRSRLGRRRALLLFGSVPLGLTFTLMWIVPPYGQIGLALYFAVAYILFDTAYTCVHVGYNSLTPELTLNYDERSSLNGYRMFYAIGGSLGSVILATVLGWKITDPARMFATLGAGLGLLCIFPPLVVFKVTSSHRTNATADPLPGITAIRSTIANRPFQLVMGLYLLSWTTASIVGATLIYFANYYLGVPEQANYFVLVAQASALAFIPLCVWLSRMFDKRRAFIMGTACWVMLLAGFLVMQPKNISIVYALAALSGFGIATTYVIPWSMIPDIIEHDALRTGQRREGTYYAFAAFFQKLGTGAALWAMGQVLARTGYINPSLGDPLPVQPQSAVVAIRLFISAVPMALLLLAIIFAWRVPITREYHRSMVEELTSREI